MIDLNRPRHVHFVGIAGIGMSALARYLVAQGHRVTGSDRSPGEQGAALRRIGIEVHAEHRGENIGDADLVVITSAANEENPEIVAAQLRGTPLIKRAVLLAAIMNPRYGVAVAGTHGKTTTSALIGHILVEGRLDPTILIGGVSANLGSNARVGGSDIVVVEADEYDASFLQLEPRVAVITNVEADHLDFYGTEQGVRDAFRAFGRRVTDTLVVCADDPVAVEIADESRAAAVTYGVEGGDWRANAIEERAERTRFHASYRKEHFAVEMGLPGMHNVRNALAAIAVARTLGVPTEVIRSALSTFRGVGRRAEVVGEPGGVLVIDDYAHHPSEIRADLAALRARYGRPIRVIFQPHTYTRTHAFLQDFAHAFADADAVYLTEIYAAREVNTLGISGRDLAEAATRQHAAVCYVDTLDGALRAALADVRPGDIVITMGAGDITTLAPRIVQALGGKR